MGYIDVPHGVAKTGHHNRTDGVERLRGWHVVRVDYGCFDKAAGQKTQSSVLEGLWELLIGPEYFDTGHHVMNRGRLAEKAFPGTYFEVINIQEDILMFALKDKTLLRSQCHVDGRWIDGAQGAAINVTNPATGEVIGTVPGLGAAETRSAIEAANRAWPAWRGRPAAERSALLRRWFELIVENQEDLAILMTAEQGVCPAGLTTMVHPAARAGPALRVIMDEGKFHGVMAAQTPIGSLTTTTRLSLANDGTVSP